ncbi:MAG: hypothetical protein JRH20_05670 [Deltaproteobacteria bacterium]|nr:hypothetical protein [Deltaproteobacteria bacterium]
MTKPLRTATLSLLAMLVALSACAPAVMPGYRFRTLQPEKVFDRALAAMQVHGKGAKVKSREGNMGTIVSEWQRYDPLMGDPQFFRFEAAIVPNSADGSATISVSLTVLACGFVGRAVILVKSVEEAKRHCSVPSRIPTKLQKAFHEFKGSFEGAVFRS